VIWGDFSTILNQKNEELEPKVLKGFFLLDLHLVTKNNLSRVNLSYWSVGK